MKKIFNLFRRRQKSADDNAFYSCFGVVFDITDKGDIEIEFINEEGLRWRHFIPMRFIKGRVKIGDIITVTYKKR